MSADNATTPAAEDVATPELAPHYYRDNFVLLCDSVEGRYGDLLQSAEQGFLYRFRALDHAAQCLYVRLVSRVGSLFRLSRLQYPEIGSHEEPLAALLESELAVCVKTLSVEELGALYTRNELVDAFGTLLDVSRQVRKPDLLTVIESLELSDKKHFELLEGSSVSAVVRIAAEEIVALLQLLFFGNHYQSLTDFVLSDLGIASYYPYRLNCNNRLFASRGALDEYIECLQLRECFSQLQESDDQAGVLELTEQLLAFEVRFTSSRKNWDKLCNRVARELERDSQGDLALELYSRSGCHPARERSARILEAREDWVGAAELCAAIGAEPWCEAEREAAIRIARRVERKTGGSATSRRKDSFDEMLLELEPDGGAVELSVASSLADDWHAVHFVENSLMNTLFGLAFWEQIFADVEGAFHNPYQSAPADMYSEGFRARRVEQLEARLNELMQLDLYAELLDCYTRYQGYQCRWADWRRVDGEMIAQSLKVMPSAHLLAIWQRQLFDPRENRNGFPDLIALGEQPGEYRMIEVKGPGDRLQENQKRWLHFFAEHQIPASVAWVSWTNA